MTLKIINKKTIVIILLCLFGVVNIYGRDIKLFLTTFRPPYYITGLTLYDEDVLLDYEELSTGRVLQKNAVFANVVQKNTVVYPTVINETVSNETVLYIHDGSKHFYDGLSKRIQLKTCPESHCDTCSQEYCEKFQQIGEYVFFNFWGKRIIPAVKIVKQNCVEIKEQLDEGHAKYCKEHPYSCEDCPNKIRIRYLMYANP